MVTVISTEMAMEKEMKQQTVPAKAKAMAKWISIARVMENLTALSMAMARRRQTQALPAKTIPEEAIHSATVVVLLDSSIVA